MSRRVMAVSRRHSPRGPSRWRRSCSQSGFQKRKRSNLSFYERGGAVKVFELIALSLRSKPSRGGASSTTLQTHSPSPTRHSLIALPGRVQPSQHTLLSRSCFTPPPSPVAWNAEPHSCPARRRSLCLRTPQSLAREQSPTPNSLPTPCCPRGGADYLPPWCARYPTSAPAAVPIAFRPCAPGTPPLPRRHCRLPPAIVRPVPYLYPRDGAGRLPHWPALVLPVPHLCPRGGADCLPPLCARYPTSAPTALPIASRHCAPGTLPLPPRRCRSPPALARTGAPGTPPLPQRRCRLPPALELPVPHLCPRHGADCIPHWRARHHAFAEPHLPTAAHLALHHSHPPPSPPPCRATSYLPPDSFHRQHWPSLDCAGVIHAPPCPPPIPQIVSCLGLRTCMPRG